MTGYAVHVLLGVTDGSTEEATIEAGDVDAVLVRVRDTIAAIPDFLAITVLHVEDLPLTLDGATEVAR